MPSTKEVQHAKVQHKDGCPAAEERIETYPATKPDGTTISITRCGDCGNYNIKETKDG